MYETRITGQEYSVALNYDICLCLILRRDPMVQIYCIPCFVPTLLQLGNHNLSSFFDLPSLTKLSFVPFIQTVNFVIPSSHTSVLGVGHLT